MRLKLESWNYLWFWTKNWILIHLHKLISFLDSPCFSDKSALCFVLSDFCQNTTIHHFWKKEHNVVNNFNFSVFGFSTKYGNPSFEARFLPKKIHPTRWYSCNNPERTKQMEPILKAKVKIIFKSENLKKCF